MEFEKNLYLSCVKENPLFMTDDVICKFAKDHPRFHYGTVDYRKNWGAYDNEGWFGRKIVALPLSLWCGVVKVIYHLAKAIFLGIPNVIFNNGSPIKANFFAVIRDLQESFGHITSFFNDRFGTFHVQEAKFQKKCYDCFTTKRSPSPTNTSESLKPTTEDSTPIPSKLKFDPELERMVEKLKQSISHPDSRVTSSRVGGRSDSKQDVIEKVKQDPTSIQHFSCIMRNDEDVVATALHYCQDSESIRTVINAAYYDAKNSKKVGLELVKKDPSQLELLGYDVKSDEDVVATALHYCQDAEAVRQVIHAAGHDAKNSKKVALELVKKDPEQLEALCHAIRNDEDVVATALRYCQGAEAVRTVINAACRDAKNSKKVALELVVKDPLQLAALGCDMRDDVDVVLLAVEKSTEDTIHEIWSYVGPRTFFDPRVRSKVESQYPDFFQNSEDDEYFGSQQSAFIGQMAPEWHLPEELSNNDSEQIVVVRTILEQHHSCGVDLTKNTVSKSAAKMVLCQMLGLDSQNNSDAAIKKSYRKAVLHIHPDKTEFAFAHEAFKYLTAAWEQAEF